MEKVLHLQQQLAANSTGDGQEKTRNWTLRRNLQELFGVLQLPVATDGRSHGGMLEYNPDRLDEYVQALRDAVVRGAHTQDPKRRNMVVDKVMKELSDMDVS